MSEFDFGPFKLVFDDEKGEAFAYKRLSEIHDYVYDEDGLEYDDDLLEEEEWR